ncbi:hypothetical protein CDD83_10520 [Cordyceps sp. RAO-2017]|nr:hypothetical protein CDD83_10520 [Cordyceps sp. RAO-2017]
MAERRESASAAKYRAADDLETQIRQKAATASQLGDEGGRKALDKELEALTDRLDRLRIEADEAYARELAAQ